MLFRRPLGSLLLAALSLGLAGACSGGDDDGADNNANPAPVPEKGMSCNAFRGGCECYADSYSPNDFACDNEVGGDSTCCASSGWPNSGYCDCMPNPACTTASCDAPRKQCTASQTELRACSGSGGNTPPANSSGSGSGGASGSKGTGGASGGKAGSKGSGGTGGSAPMLCSPKSGECDSSSDCACGQGCYASAVCNTCATRCHFNCITNQDCVDLSKTLTVKYTRCAKTSPNFEIYACE